MQEKAHDIKTKIQLQFFCLFAKNARKSSWHKNKNSTSVFCLFAKNARKTHEHNKSAASYQMRQNRFFLGTWLTVIFLKSPLAMADLRGRNMFTWRPTLIFLVSAPCGNIACTCNTRERVTASQCYGSGSASKSYAGSGAGSGSASRGQAKL